MTETVKTLLSHEGIRLCAPIALSELKILRPYLLEKNGMNTDGTAFLFAIPYYTTECDHPARNISAYAVSADYHGYMKKLFDRVLPALREKYPENIFLGFSDHSPIAEADAAVRAGLGFFGHNHLFLTHEYSSYVFLGEIITDASVPSAESQKSECIGCDACLRECPVGMDLTRCLSALTQKKGTLTEEEEKRILENGMVWGCDRCQEVCPVTKSAKENGTLYSDISYFKESALPHLTLEAVQNMSQEEFESRAFSWRGRETILRNLKLFERKEKR